MATKRTKHLSYIEDTRKHHYLIDAVAGESTSKAVKATLADSVPVTYLEGNTIVKVDKTGAKKILATIENNRRKVVVGARSILPKK